MTTPKKFYTVGEEIFNSVTHGVGALLAVAGLVILVVESALFGDGWALASSLVYGITLIILYVMSTLYHSFTGPRVKAVFRIFDHCTIYLLIAGTYTPLCLVTLREDGGFWLFGVVWAAAVLGVVLNAVSLERFKVFSYISYVAMGWVAVFAMEPLLRLLPWPALVLLFSGGICYTGGLVFFAVRKKFMHSIWHLFVLAGSVLHYLMIALYISPSVWHG